MTSKLTEDFVACFSKLPEAVREQARKNYRLGRDNPSPSSLKFKRIHSREDMYSVRVGLGWRAVGLLENDVIYWFWIGSHSDYDRLLKQL